MLYSFKKGKNTIEVRKKVPWTEKVLCLIEQSKVVSEHSCWRFLLDDAAQWRRQAEVDSDQIETLIENNQRYTMWERAGILKISKPIELLVKRKNVPSTLRKKPHGLAGLLHRSHLGTGRKAACGLPNRNGHPSSEREKRL